MSGHADKGELFRWLQNFKDSPKITFTTHGEGTDLHAYAKNIRETFGWNVTVPKYLESFEVFEGI
jgi:metallo-beta-lactamase family protein